MSLNDVQLSPHMLAHLYTNTLVETNATAVPNPAIRSLGGNGKFILIAVDNKEEVYLPESDLSFLTSILAACKLSLADIAIVNIQNAGTANYQQLISFFKSQYVLLFDVAPLQFGLPINFPNFQIQQFDNCTYLSAPALRLIENDKSLKKDLWNALKNLFQI